MSERIVVGKFVSPHGLKGYIKLLSFLEQPESIFSYEKLSNKEGSATYSIKLKTVLKKQFLVSVKGIYTKEAASKLTNQHLYLTADMLPELTEDTFYISDLQGMQVIDHHTHVTLGTIKAMHNFGAGDIVEISPEDGKTSYMIMFNKEHFPLVDTDKHYVTCIKPEILNATP